MARGVDVLGNLFGLPVTSGGEVSWRAGSLAPGDALCRPHFPLESPVVVGGDTALQDALDCASV